MTVQTEITARPSAIAAGQQYDSATDQDIVSGIATQPLAFGVYVIQKNTGWEIPTSEADVQNFIGGVTMIDNNVPTEQGYAEGDNIRVMVEGRCGVNVQASMVRGDSVFVRIAAGTSTKLGEFSAVADAANTVAMPGFRVYSPGTATVAILDLNSPGATA